MANPNFFIGTPNLADVDYWSPVFLPNIGNWRQTAWLTNLQIPELAYKARSVNLTPDSTRFCLDLTVGQSILAVAIPRHNMSLSATMKVTLFADGDANLTTPLATQTVQVATTYAWGSLPYGHPSWFTGVITAEAARFFPQPAMVLLGSAVIARYVLVEIVDTGNTATYIELNRLVVVPGYQPSINIAYGAQFYVIDPSIVTYTLGGRKAVDKRPMYRRIIAQIPYLPQDEAFANVFDMQLRLGVSGQCFVSALPTNVANLGRVSFLATLNKLDPLTAASFGYQGVAFAFDEVIA